jgi:hypothetical protein
MRGKAHLLCSSLSDFAPDETKRLLLLQGYVVVGGQASPNARKSKTYVQSSFSSDTSLPVLANL